MLILSGCGLSAVRDFDSPNNPKRVLYEQWNRAPATGDTGAHSADTFRTGKYQEKYNTHMNSASNAKADSPEREKFLEDARQERNTQLDAFLTGVDVYYQRNKNLFITTRAGAATAFDVTQLSLTGVASLASHGTANILSAVATGIHGTRLSIDKNLFQDQASLLVAAKMEQLRTEKLAEIEKRKKNPVADYSLEAAMRDGLEYYYVGTVNGALLALFQDTGAKQQESTEELRTTLSTN